MVIFAFMLDSKALSPRQGTFDNYNIKLLMFNAGDNFQMQVKMNITCSDVKPHLHRSRSFVA